MAQESGMVQRGLLLLGLMLILVAVMGFILFRPVESAPQVDPAIKALSKSKDGWEVRYNAAVALARRGSKELPCDVLAEMLDERQQMRNYIMTAPDGSETIDEQAARRTVLNALKALEEWLKHKEALPALVANNAAGWRRVQAALYQVAQSENAVLREQAETLKQAIGSR